MDPSMAIPQRPPFMRNTRPAGLALSLLAFAVLACGGAESSSTQARSRSLSSAAATPSLGSAANFAVLAGTAVTCTSATVTGNVGVSPGTVITQTSCPVTGTIQAGNTVAAQAHSDFVTAYDAFKALPCTRTLTTLDGQRLSPGVYCFDAAATSAGGVLTLDGPSNGTWIFKVGTLGTGALTGTSFSVVTPGGAAPSCGSVYWWVAEAVTLTDSKFVGTILAGAAITLTRGAFNGNALAKAAATITGTAATGCALGGGSSSCASEESGSGHHDESDGDTCDDGGDHRGGGDREGGDDHHGGDDRGGDDHDGHHKDHGNKGGRGK
jgi:ice-binding like protein